MRARAWRTPSAAARCCASASASACSVRGLGGQRLAHRVGHRRHRLAALDQRRDDLLPGRDDGRAQPHHAVVGADHPGQQHRQQRRAGTASATSCGGLRAGRRRSRRSRRRAARRPGTGRSRSPRRGGCRARRGSRCASPRRSASISAVAAERSASAQVCALVEPHQRRLDASVGVSRPRLQRDLHRLERVVAAVGIAGEVGLAHAAHQHRRRRAGRPAAAAKPRNSRLRPGTKVLGRPLACISMARSAVSAVSRDLAQQRRGRAGGRRPAARPSAGTARAQRRAHAGAAVELDAMALAVVEADGLDARVARERPGQAGGGILAAGEQHQGAAGIDHGTGGS